MLNDLCQARAVAFTNMVNFFRDETASRSPTNTGNNEMTLAGANRRTRCNMLNPGIYQSWSLCWPGASPRCNTTRTHRIDHDVDHLVDHNLYLVIYDTLCTIRVVQFRPRKQNMCYCRPHHPQIIRQHELSIGQVDHVGQRLICLMPLDIDQ